MPVQFGNNWIQKMPLTAKLDTAYCLLLFWLSSEFFSSNYFQTGQHVVLLHIQIVWFAWVEIFQIWIVGFCVPLAHHRYPAASSFFHKQMYVHIIQVQLQLHLCLLQPRISRQSRRCVVVRWIQPVLLQAYASKIFKQIRLRTKIRFEIQLVIIC